MTRLYIWYPFDAVDKGVGKRQAQGKSIHLLGLLCLGEPALAPPLSSLWAGLGVKNVVPPAEAAGIVANETLVVSVVVVGTSPEWQEVVKTPGKLVATVGIDGLEQTSDDPHVHGQDVEVLGDGAVEDRRTNGTETEDQHLNWRCVLSSQAERSRVVVVDLVDVLVEVGEDVHRAVSPVVP